MQINCDGVVHNPLGGASYVFEKEFIPYILETLHKNKLKISVGAQPNSSPHFGTLETIALAFALARKLEEYDSKKKVTILYEVIETAPSETVVIDGVKYQKSPEHGEYSVNVNEGISKLEYNSSLRNLIRGMSYTATNQSENYDFEILRITGSDYAGFYQEELRYKVASYLGCKVSDMSMIFYAPLVLDWSGAKMSKSLYVKKDAYGDIPKRFINYSFLKDT